jgi:hypothetical protein
MDSKTLITRVFDETGIRIGEKDPVFATVVMNEAVIQHMLQQHLQNLDERYHQITKKYIQWEKQQESWRINTENQLFEALSNRTEAAKMEIETIAQATAVTVAKEAFSHHIKPSLIPIEDASRRLDRCSREAAELIQKASPSSDIKLWERCLSIFLSSLAGSLLTLLVLGVLLKTGRLPVYQPVLPAEEIAKELSKELNKPKAVQKNIKSRN